jgi:hypothetical protein
VHKFQAPEPVVQFKVLEPKQKQFEKMVKQTVEKFYPKPHKLEPPKLIKAEVDNLILAYKYFYGTTEQKDFKKGKFYL